MPRPKTDAENPPPAPTDAEIARIQTKFGRRGAILWLLHRDYGRSEWEISRMGVSDVCDPASQGAGPAEPCVSAHLTHRKGHRVWQAPISDRLRRQLRMYLHLGPVAQQQQQPAVRPKLDVRDAEAGNDALFPCRNKRNRGAGHGQIGSILRKIKESERQHTLQETNRRLRRELDALREGIQREPANPVPSAAVVQPKKKKVTKRPEPTPESRITMPLAVAASPTIARPVPEVECPVVIQATPPSYLPAQDEVVRPRDPRQSWSIPKSHLSRLSRTATPWSS